MGLASFERKERRSNWSWKEPDRYSMPKLCARHVTRIFQSAGFVLLYIVASLDLSWGKNEDITSEN